MIGDGVFTRFGERDRSVADHNCSPAAVLGAGYARRFDRRRASVLFEGRIIACVDRLAAALQELDLQHAAAILVAMRIAARCNIIITGHRPREHRFIGALRARRIGRFCIARFKHGRIGIFHGVDVAIDR